MLRVAPRRAPRGRVKSRVRMVTNRLADSKREQARVDKLRARAVNPQVKAVRLARGFKAALLPWVKAVPESPPDRTDKVRPPRVREVAAATTVNPARVLKAREKSKVEAARTRVRRLRARKSLPTPGKGVMPMNSVSATARAAPPTHR